jgi:hypothetical protein
MIVCCRRPPHRKYFLQILAGATNAEIVTDPESAVLPGDVYVDITAPDGSHAAVPLHQTGAGIFEGSAAAGLPGIYPARFLATGTTRHGSPFTRDVLRTGAVWRGGDGTPRAEPPTHADATRTSAA